MKKIFAFLICIFLVSQVLGQWTVGARFGANFCVTKGKWFDDDDTKYKWIGAPTAGVTGGYDFSESLSLFADISYIKAGGIYEYTWEETLGREVTDVYKVKERYNCFHLVIRPAYIFDCSAMTLMAFLGPYITIKGGGRAIITEYGETEKYKIVWEEYPDKREDLLNYYVDPKYYRKFDAGLYLGAAAGKELGPGRLELDLRYGIGLIDGNKFDSKDEKKDAKEDGYKAFRHMNAAITVAYLIPLGNK
jgi:hypothetical protein